jgi:hypothetical protein
MRLRAGSPLAVVARIICTGGSVDGKRDEPRHSRASTSLRLDHPPAD